MRVGFTELNDIGENGLTTSVLADKKIDGTKGDVHCFVYGQEVFQFDLHAFGFVQMENRSL
jgi:hypothetical protein